MLQEVAPTWPAGESATMQAHSLERDPKPQFKSAWDLSPAPSSHRTWPQTLAWGHLGKPIGLGGAGRRGMEGLEVYTAEGDDHPPWLAAQGCDTGAHALEEDALLVVFQPTRVEALVVLVLLSGQLTL